MKKTSRTISLAGRILSRYLLGGMTGLVSLTVFLAAMAANAQEDRQSFIVFPEAVSQKNISDDDVNSDLRLTILHYSQYKQFKTLLEFSANKDHETIERLQFGWQFDKPHRVWIGRSHTPAGYWNTEYHHGTYLQTSLSRPTPTLITWPRHTTGFTIEGDFNEGKFVYIFTGGRGATQEGDEIEDYDLFHRGGDYGTNATFKLSFHPDPMEATEMGIFIARFKIPVTDSTISDLDQTVSGLFLNWENEQNRVISEIFHHRTNADAPGKSNLTTAYIQYERRVSQVIKPYIRLEDSWPDKDSQLLNIFTQYPSSKQLVGLRFDVNSNNAITLELSRTTHGSDNANAFSLKWSAIFP